MLIRAIKNKLQLPCLLIFLLVATVLFDPGRFFSGAAEASTIITLIYFAFHLGSKGLASLYTQKNLIWVSVNLTFLIVAVYGLALTAIQLFLRKQKLSVVDYSYLTWLIWLSPWLLLSITTYRSVAITVFRISIRLLAIWILILLFIWLTIDWKGHGWFIHNLFKAGNLYADSRTYGEINFPYIYWISSPLLIFGIGLEFQKYSAQLSRNETTNYFNTLIILLEIFALFVSGTRANMLCATIYFVILFILIFKKFVWHILSIALIFFAIAAPTLTHMFSSTEGSNSKKIHYLNTYQKIWSNPSFLIWGQGYSGIEFSEEFNSIIPHGATKTELTYLEILRTFGTIFGITLMAILIVTPIYIFAKHNEYYLANGFALYMATSFTNPYLFSRMGATFLGIVFCYIYSLRSSKNHNPTNSANVTS